MPPERFSHSAVPESPNMPYRDKKDIIKKIDEDIYFSPIYDSRSFNIFRIVIGRYIIHRVDDIESLKDDYYEYNENTHELVGQGYSDEMHIVSFKIGSTFKVKLTNVNVEAREITFEL